IEIADHGEDNVIRLDVLRVPSQQILARDGGDRVVLRHTSVRALCPVTDLGRFSFRDLLDCVIATRDSGPDLVLGQIDFVLAEFRVVKKVTGQVEHKIKIALQAGERHEDRQRAAAGFEFGGAGLQEIVEFISGLALASAGAPGPAIYSGQPDLVPGLVLRSPTNGQGGLYQWKLMVLLQEDSHPILQLKSFWLLGMEFR